MEPTLFDFAADQLEQRTALDRLEARGTLRIALKKAGLDPKDVTTEHLRVVLAKLMPVELEARGVENAPAICDMLTRELMSSKVVRETSGATDVHDIFRRLGGR